ncbi:polymorphic toxin-type HINT domain-containing protein [Nocardioides sp. WV_118_6]
MGEFDAARPGVAGLKSAWERAAAASGFDGQFPGSWGPGARAFFEAEIWAQVCNQQQVCDSQLTETVGMWRTFVHDRKAGLMSDGASWDKINGGNPVELMLNGTWVDRYAEVTAESSATAEAMLGDAAVGLRALSALRRASGLSKRPQQRPQQGGPCSFAGSTEVLMADGSLKPIDEVVVGDEVVATDPETGEQAAKRVSRVWVHRDDLIALALNADVDGDGRPDRLVTTEDHPFWNATDGVWEGPQDLDVGDELVDDHGRRVGVLGLEPGSTRVGWAYNLTVEDLHTYHVGASRLLVHNTNEETCGIGITKNRGDVPVGPAPEDAWTVLNRVDAKGAPLPGYKGGKEFLNDGSQGAWRLPEGPIYREWDLSAKVKGIPRDGRRLVTGSDGSAYYTSDHYASFTQFR